MAEVKCCRILHIDDVIFPYLIPCCGWETELSIELDRLS